MDCFLRCKYKDEVIVPYVALYPNIQPFYSKNVTITTKDGIKAKMKEIKEVHICEIEEDVKRIYNIDMWSFLKKWYNFDKSMQNMYFVKLRLEKTNE